MDHKVSKDMISSGMIPSGEKTQADLGRTQYGSAPSPSSLVEAYRSIYEHHQKDADGNVIPHEEKEELNEGKMPEGLKNYLMKKKGKKEDKKEEMKKESVDLFDLVKGKLIDEGCEEKEALKIMANMTKEEFDEVSEGVGAALLGGALATGLAIKGVQMRNKMKNDAKKRDTNTNVGKIQAATDAKNKALRDAGMGGY